MNAADEILGPALAQGLDDHAALLCGTRALTYRQLDDLVNRCANALLRLGVARQERVLFLVDDMPELVGAYLAVMRAGAVAVALNVRLAAKDLLFSVTDSECRVIFVEQQFLPLYRQIAAALASPPHVVVIDGRAPDMLSFDAFLEGAPPQFASAAMLGDDMAFWVYSSGTTGQPKAAVHAHRGALVADLHLSGNLGVRSGDRVYTTSKLFFAFALGHSLLAGLRAGATVILHRGWPDAADVARTIEEQQPDVVFSVPTMYRNLLKDGHAHGPAFRRVRHYVCAGEKLPEGLFAQWRAATGSPILEGIGTSETIFLFIASTPAQFRAGSCGKPVPWAQVQLVEENGAPITEPGRPGVLRVKMGSVFARYWKQPALSERTLDGGWYVPGDMFSFDADGYWYHHGRVDDMLKISGQWVSPSEIESCAAAVPQVSEAAVVGVENDDGLVRLAMFVVPREAGIDQAQLAEAIQERIKSELSIYKCPRTIRFVDELPRTPTGKMQKFKLRQLLPETD